MNANHRYLLAPHILEATRRLLRTYGTAEDPHEGVVLWGGLAASRVTIITTCLAPAAVTTPGSFQIPFEESLRVGAYFRDHGITYVGQVHSHPYGCGVGHSWGDDDQAYLKFEGLLSIVAGEYAEPKDCLEPLTNAGVHRFEGGEFRRMSATEVRLSFAQLEPEVDLRSRPQRRQPGGRSE